MANFLAPWRHALPGLHARPFAPAAWMRHLQPLLAILLLAAAYGAAARLGLSYSSLAPNVTLIWAPTGIGLFAVLRWGPRLWPGIVLGDLVANAGTGAPWFSVLGISAGNVLQALACAWVLRRCGFGEQLERVRDVVLLIGFGTAGAALSACIGPAALVLGGSIAPAAYPSVWLQWLMGDATGVVVLTPLLLAWWRRPEGQASPWAGSALAPARAAEGALLLAVLALLCAAIFSRAFDAQLALVPGLVPGAMPGYYPASLALFPLAVWAALRFGLRGATLLTLLVSVAAVGGTVRGIGPFVDGGETSSLLRWWLFANVITVTSLLLASSQSERDQARAEAIRDRDFSSAILDAEGALVVVLDAAWQIRRVNRAFELATGFAPADLQGRPFLQALVPEEQHGKLSAHAEMLRLNLGPAAGARLDSVLRRRRGPPITVSWTTSVLRDAQGRIAHVIVSGVDVSARVEAAEALRHARRQLESRVAERTRDLAAANEELQAEMAERHRLEQALLQISEREQQRFGEELHDGLGQHLTAAAIQAELLAGDLQALGEQEAHEAALRIEAMLSDAVSQARLLARGLFPVEIEGRGLMAALDELAQATRLRTRTPCALVCPEPIDLADHAVAVHLYRIAQEAVTNAVKHAPGAEVHIALSRSAGVLSLSVRNGAPTQPVRPAAPGIGLRILRHRAALIGAALSMGPAEGGWRVALTYPAPVQHLPQETPHAS